MIVVIYAVTSFVSSFLFILLISLSLFDSLNYFVLTDLLLIWGVFVLPVFLIGGFIALCVVYLVQEFITSRNYFISLLIFILFGIICNIYALGHFVKNGWDDGVLEYLILGVVGSVLYFHVWLLLNKLAAKARVNVLRQS